MSEQTPQVGDSVRVVIEAVVSGLDDHGRVAQVGGSYGTHDWISYVPQTATVQVLERADDPAEDPTGTVRRSPDGVVAAKSPNPDYPWRGFGEPCGENFATVSVVGWPVIGAVPGTPAAEASGLVSFLAPADWRLQLDGADPAYLLESWQVSGPAEAEQTAEARDLPIPVRQEVAELVIAGSYDAATNRVRQARPSWSLTEILAFVKAMPEWETGRNHRPVEDVPLPPELRVFRSDGPEPPSGVYALEWLDFDPENFACRYLVRVAGGWAWTNDPANPNSRSAPRSWPPVAAPAQFREVV